jgi:ABC-2 type transport system ATP-binding protein
MTDSILEVKNLTKHFGKFTAVNDISFSLQRGEVLGLLGPNGAGKTTTIQMLLGVMKPSSGTITYFGKMFEKHREEILEQINFSSTYISFPELFTVSEILDVFSRLYAISDRKKRINKLLDEFEMSHLVKKQFYMLSAGEKTRLLLAKSFLNYPKIILLDEPTASLDPEIAIKIRKFLKREREEYGVSMLFTSHNMNEVEEMCDKIIVLNNGISIAKDTPENLVKSIANTELELLIKDDTEKAINFFNKIEIPFEQNRFNFKITMDEKRIAEFLMLLAEEKIQYEEISIEKPNLEDYFLQVVGKNI